jgi:hypothetical protein
MLHEHLLQSLEQDFLPRYVTFVIFVIAHERTKADAATLRRMSAAILQLSNVYGRPRRYIAPKDASEMRTLCGSDRYADS